MRVSDIESPETALRLAGQVSWVWCDFFDDLSIDPKRLKELSDVGFKICYVSPELHGPNYIGDIEKLQRWMVDNSICPDAVCTKMFGLWENMGTPCN